MAEQTKNAKQTGVSITIVNSDLPTLKYPTWMDISYHDQVSEKELLSALEQNLPMAEDLARSTGTHQIKLATDPEWDKLPALGFSPAVYHMHTTISALSIINAETYTTGFETDLSKYSGLITDYYAYQRSADPDYYTTDTGKGVEDFLEKASADIGSGNAFFIIVSRTDRPVGFLYGGYSSPYGILQEIFVIEEERNKGFGTAMLKAASGAYDDGGCREVVGYVGVSAPATEFYKARSFRKIAKVWIKDIK